MKFERNTNLIAMTLAESKKRNETRDCFVIAISMVCGVEYGKVHSILKHLGRRPRCGTYTFHGIKAINILGKRVRSEFIRYEHVKKVTKGKTKNILSRHFNEENAEYFVKTFGPRFIAMTTRHAIPVINGIAHDWSHDKSLRIVKILVIEEK